MTNRRFTAFDQLKVGPDLPRPLPGGKKGPGGSVNEKTANWPKAPGQKGPGLNRIGWPEVKAYPAQDLADDKSPRKPFTRAKAKEILSEKNPTLHGKKPTEKQKGLLGLIAGGGTPSRKKGFKG